VAKSPFVLPDPPFPVLLSHLVCFLPEAHKPPFGGSSSSEVRGPFQPAFFKGSFGSVSKNCRPTDHQEDIQKEKSKKGRSKDEPKKDCQEDHQEKKSKRHPKGPQEDRFQEANDQKDL
jgi:hypothetical protein